jgi:hypothetical protein
LLFPQQLFCLITSIKAEEIQQKLRSFFEWNAKKCVPSGIYNGRLGCNSVFLLPASAGFSLDLFFIYENYEVMFLRNGELSPNDMALQLIRLYCS